MQVFDTFLWNQIQKIRADKHACHDKACNQRELYFQKQFGKICSPKKYPHKPQKIYKDVLEITHSTKYQGRYKNLFSNIGTDTNIRKLSRITDWFWNKLYPIIKY